MKLARWIFLVAGVYGVLALAPGLLVEAFAGVCILNPQFYYGFIGLALVWQLAFFLIASEPARYRPLMLIAVAEKAAFLVPSLALFAAHRIVSMPAFIGAMIDGVLMLLFLLAWRASRPALNET